MNPSQAETRTVRVRCPTCKASHELDVPVAAFDRAGGESGILTVSSHLPCNHACHVFVDQQFKMRGGQCADITIDGRATPATVASATDEEVLALLVAKILGMSVQNLPAFSSIGAGGKLDAIESVLLHGDVLAASAIARDVSAFAAGIGEDDVTRHMESITTLLDAFLDEKGDVVFTLAPDAGAGKMQAVLQARAGAIKAGLEYMAVDGSVPRDDVPKALTRLGALLARDGH